MKKWIVFLFCLISFICFGSCTGKEPEPINDVVTHVTIQDPKMSAVTYGIYSYPSRFLADVSFYYETLPKEYCDSLKEKRKNTWHNIEYIRPVLCRYSYIDLEEKSKLHIQFFDPCFSDLSFWSDDHQIYTASTADFDNLILKAETTLDKSGRLFEFKFLITEQNFIRMVFSYDEDNNMTGLRLYDETDTLHIEVNALYKNGAVQFYSIKDGGSLRMWFIDNNGIFHLRHETVSYPRSSDMIIKKTKEGVAKIIYYFDSGDYMYAKAYYYNTTGAFLYGERWAATSNERETFTEEKSG